MNKLEDEMSITITAKPIIFLGIQWFHNIEQLPDDMNSTKGCLIDVFSNDEFGKFALIYVNPNTINIEEEDYSKMLQNIRNKWREDVPYIILGEQKYKSLCKEWNNFSNTICLKEDFENQL
jgi:hypothetical protein